MKGTRSALLALALALCLGPGRLWPQGLGPQTGARGTGPERAVLTKGTFALRGLPFFGPNAIPALGGEYSLGAAAIPVWFTRESLVFSERWKRTTIGAHPAFLLQPKEGQEAKGAVFALSLGAYSLFAQVPGDEAAGRLFVDALERRFAVFYANARNDSELSFPAFLDLGQP
ncbi:MAG TPA: hypothetical protein VFL04_00045 [Rectinemataceae bacterium]|nr:hypothetical protein [Rectinemataceae bacterium]